MDDIFWPLKKLNEIKSLYPYSFYATHAELRKADILFEQGNFSEAAASYIVFKDFHPRYQDLQYVIWKIAESFYGQLPGSFDRDLSPGKNAIRYYQMLLRSFPHSKHAPKAQEKN